MAMKADIKRVAKRLIPASIWNIWRRSHGRQNRHCIRHDKVPEHLFRNHRVLPRDKAFVLENSIRTHYHKGWRAEEKYRTIGLRKTLKTIFTIASGTIGSALFRG